MAHHTTPQHTLSTSRHTAQHTTCTTAQRNTHHRTARHTPQHAPQHSVQHKSQHTTAHKTTCITTQHLVELQNVMHTCKPHLWRFLHLAWWTQTSHSESSESAYNLHKKRLIIHQINRHVISQIKHTKTARHTPQHAPQHSVQHKSQHTTAHKTTCITTQHLVELQNVMHTCKPHLWRFLHLAWWTQTSHSESSESAYNLHKKRLIIHQINRHVISQIKHTKTRRCFQNVQHK